jgi:hypothetical protein
LAFWRRHLVEGGEADATDGRQPLLAELLHLGGKDVTYSPV